MTPSSNAGDELDKVLHLFRENIFDVLKVASIHHMSDEWLAERLVEQHQQAKAAIEAWSAQQVRETLKKMLEQKVSAQDLLNDSNGFDALEVPIETIQLAIANQGIKEGRDV
jgi:hypothetical protein